MSRQVHPVSSAKTLALVALVTLGVAGCGAYSRDVYPASEPPPELVELVQQNGELVLGLADVSGIEIPHFDQVHELVRSGIRREESLWWIDALGARYLLSPEAAKYHDAFECVAEAKGWCVYSVPGPAPYATLVSKHRLKSLGAPTSLYDVSRVRAYAEWARRPEAVRVTWRNDETEAELNVDAGPHDAIRLREPHEAGWTAAAQGRTLEVRADPIGYTVIDPGGAYAGVLTLRRAGDPNSGGETLELPATEVAIVPPGGVVNATTFAADPIPRGSFGTVYGRRFTPGPLAVELDGIPVEVTYAAANQINFRVPESTKPGSKQLTVIARGLPAAPASVEIAP